MNVLTFFAITLVSSCLPLYSKWAPPTLQSLVEFSEFIVVAELNSITNDKSAQHATINIISTIKGDATGEIQVVAPLILEICAPHFTFPEHKGTKYLLFLSKTKAHYNVVSGHFGALTITDRKVLWFTDPTQRQGMSQRVLTPLVEVIPTIFTADKKTIKSP